MAEEPKKLPRTNLEEKLMIIDYFKNSNKPQSETVEHFKDKFSISTSSFSEWLKHEDELRQRYMKAVNGPQGVSENIKLSKRKSTFKYGPINEAMHKIVSERLSMNLPVTEPILRHYWATFTKEYGVTDPKRAECFSHGWLANFKKRHGLTKAKKTKIIDDNALKSNDISHRKVSTESISESLKLSHDLAKKNPEYANDDFMRDENEFRKLKFVKNTAVIEKPSINRNQHTPDSTPVSGTEPNDRTDFSDGKRRKTTPSNNSLGLFNTPTNYTFPSSDMSVQLPLFQNSEKKKASNSSATLNYLLTTNENESACSSLSNVRPKLDIDFPLLATDYQKPSIVSFGKANNSVAANSESSVGAANNMNLTERNYRNGKADNGGGEKDNIINGSIPDNSNVGNNHVLNKNSNFGSGTSTSTSQGTQFNLQQILNSHISEPPISTPKTLHSSLGRNLKSVISSKTGPPYQNLMYGGRNGSNRMVYENMNTSNSSLNSNGIGALLSSSQLIQLENLPHAQKKTSSAINSVSSSTLPVQSLPANASSQTSANVTFGDARAPYRSYPSNSQNLEQALDDIKYSTNFNRTALDLANNNGKNVLNSVHARPLHTITGRARSSVASQHNMLKSKSEGAVKNIVTSTKAENSRSSSADIINGSTWTLDNESFDGKDMISIDSMERLLFVYADNFFRQYKETHEFDQSRELFDEFKTRFMADKLRHISQQKTRWISAEDTSVNPNSGGREYDPGLSNDIFLRR